MNKMMESIRDISNLNNLDDLLTKILENSLSVIPVADMGVLWMYNEEDDILMPKAWAGGPTEEIQKMRMKVGEGIIGKTFKENKSIILHTFEEMWQECLTISIKNLEHFQNSYHFKTLQSVISVPIVVEEKTLCALMIYQNGQYPLLTTRDQELLESFSDQVSIALTNSRLFQHFKEQNRILIQRDEIHDTLMKLSLQNKGLKVIANEVRRMVNLRISIVDFTDNSVYSSPTNWHKNTPFPMMKTIASIKSARFKTIDVSVQKKTFYFHPIIAIDTLIGMLIIDVNEDQLNHLDKIIFEQSSTVIALEMIRQQSLTDSFYKITNERFQDFLQTKEYSHLFQKGNELCIDQHSYSTAIIIQLKFHTSIHFMNMQVHRLVSDVKKSFQHHAPVVFGFQNKVTVLCQFPQHIHTTDFAHRLQMLQTNWQFANDVSLQIAIGTCYNGLDTISKSYSEAEKTLSFLQSRQLNGAMHYQDIGINRLFLQQSTEELNTFIDEVFLPLQSENDRNLMLEETLLAYVRNNRSISITAKQLYIHVNTLYQRLKKIEEKLKISFTNPEDTLKLQLACFLKQSNMSLIK
ncbi:helix-turn-helix domain-containing protein [Neobacillus drentensis]|uniref:helix-turn-helix domain-containing protein n=1 Tax=Neobacillus drentensis TaxID=220684 RepID=UPI003000E3E3